MAYDEGLATRIRDAIGDRPGLAEQQMFGGLAFLVQGNMACGVRGEDLIVRVAADAAEVARGHSYCWARCRSSARARMAMHPPVQVRSTVRERRSPAPAGPWPSARRWRWHRRRRGSGAAAAPG